MRQGSNPRRSRGRGPRKPHNPHNHNQSRPQNFDGSGQDVRVRGNTYQVMEKYLALARDASLAGDRIAMENYLQHAEHYYRTINADGNRPRPPMRNDGQSAGDGNQNNGQYGNGQPGNVQAGNGQPDGGQPGNGQANGSANNGFDSQRDGNGQDREGQQDQGQQSQRATPVTDPTDETEEN